MKKKMLKLIVGAMILTCMSLPVMAENRLEGESTCEQEIPQAEDLKICEDEVYNDLYSDLNLGAIEGVDGNVEFFVTGGEATEGIDGFIPEEEFRDACEAAGKDPNALGGDYAYYLREKANNELSGSTAEE